MAKKKNSLCYEWMTVLSDEWREREDFLEITRREKKGKRGSFTRRERENRVSSTLSILCRMFDGDIWTAAELLPIKLLTRIWQLRWKRGKKCLKSAKQKKVSSILRTFPTNNLLRHWTLVCERKNEKSNASDKFDRKAFINIISYLSVFTSQSQIASVLKHAIHHRLMN